MALAAAFGRDDAQDHAGRHAEQVGGHQPLCRKDHRVIQRQPHAGAVREDIDDPAGGIQNIHAAQLHVGVILHVGQLVGIALAHLVHGRRRADARIDAETHLVHHALVVQHHALELEDGLFSGRGPVRHGLQLALGGVDGVGEQPQLPRGVEGPGRGRFHMMLQPAHLPQHQPRRSRSSFIHLHRLSPPAEWAFSPARSGYTRPAPAKRYWAPALPVPHGQHPHCPRTAAQSSASAPDRR